MASHYKSLKEFYPYYLSEHQNPICRALHFGGTALSLSLFAFFLWQQLFSYIWICFVCGYFFAWVGHVFFEKNRPATFKYPAYSFASDFILFYQILVGREKI